MLPNIQELSTHQNNPQENKQTPENKIHPNKC